MYEYTPKRKTKSAEILSLAMFAVAIVLFILSRDSNFSLINPAIVQFAATAFAAVGIFVVSKYIVMKYVYVVSEKEDGSIDFSVVQISGSRKCTECLISLSSVKEVKKINGKFSKDEQKKYSSFYSYCTDLFPSESVVLSVDNGGELLGIKIQPDEKLIGLICKYSENEIIF